MAISYTTPSALLCWAFFWAQPFDTSYVERVRPRVCGQVRLRQVGEPNPLNKTSGLPELLSKTSVLPEYVINPVPQFQSSYPQGSAKSLIIKAVPAVPRFQCFLDDLGWRFSDRWNRTQHCTYDTFIELFKLCIIFPKSILPQPAITFVLCKPRNSGTLELQ